MSTTCISVFALTVRPVLGPWSPAELQLAQALLIAGWLFLLRVTAASGEDLDQWLGEAVLDALHAIHMPVKDAADRMRMDESHLRQALRGEPAHHLSLNRVLRLGLVFWCCFGPTLFAVVVRHHLAQIAEDLKLRKSA